MSPTEQRQRIRVVCTECAFSTVIDTGEESPAETVVEHGRNTGHKLSTEEIED